MEGRKPEYASYIISSFQGEKLPEHLEREIRLWMADPGNEKEVDAVLKECWDEQVCAETKRTYMAMAAVGKRLRFSAERTERNDLIPDSEMLYGVMSDQSFNPGAKYYDRPKSAGRSGKRCGMFVRVAAVALPVMALAGAGLAVYRSLDRGGFETVVMQTAAGQQHAATLPDGTKVMLNENSRFEYVADRKATLTGEAFLKVNGGPGVPFYLETEAVRVKVTGTELNVTAYDGTGRTAVKLFAGNAEVAAGKNTYVMDEGSRVDFDHETGELLVERIGGKAPGWIAGKLCFRDRTLPEILEVLGWYYMVDLDLGQDVDGSTRYSLELDGSEKMRDALDMLRAVSEGAFAYEIGDGMITIKAAE